MSLVVTGLYRYPVKSCRGEPLREAVAEPWGLAGDRRWMVADPGGAMVSAREHPRLLLVAPFPEPGAVRLTGPGMPELTVRVPQGNELIPVTVWESTLLAARACDAGSAWFSKVVGEPVRLVYLDDPTRRRPEPRYSRDGDRVSLADGYPLLLTAEDSLAELNQRIAGGPYAAEGPLPMRRFRPSAVVHGAQPWAEDRWRRLRIGEVAFRVAKGCARCVMTMIDPDTAVTGKEPVATLARCRRWDGKVWFGVNLIPDSPPRGAVIGVGDLVHVLEQDGAGGGPLR